MELSFEQIDSHLKDTQQEKRRVQEQLAVAQQKIQALEDDITQSRAHMDLYRIELEELGEDRDALKVIMDVKLFHPSDTVACKKTTYATGFLHYMCRINTGRNSWPN